jgi:hypothetical protein
MAALNRSHFLNVDLDIYSKVDLQPLADALGSKVDVLYCGREGARSRKHVARFELAADVNDADSAIRRLCGLIHGLPPDPRALWDAATSREFSIGLQAGARPRSIDFVIEAATIAAVAELNGRISITLYAPIVSSR